ncbi:putative hydrolase of the HAD superfamily [Celeribacter marinus]|uniref:Pyridoxal-5'-phosphate phosphatase, Alphaproteobacterial type n=2 Tax=Celeribacter marinus TaxID=1397108 RepID=A0A0N9ZN00_9RHOB|nr:pyridoxal-5'-phosphate phosphatase, Alphaproteobacterial type [Celeribacter marinus]SFK55173.1 putative hydrolase of the HAD superfamily [Celeribacter marinus]
MPKGPHPLASRVRLTYHLRMVSDHFSHVQEWIFDLDNTLYPPSACLFEQIEPRMTAWVQRELNVSRDEANRLRHTYWRDYGTTLSGMMRLHGTDPLPYLTYVHDIDFSTLPADPALRAAIHALPGRKIVYTNGSEPYANRVLEARGLTGLFDAIYGIEHADFHPKPIAQAFDTILKKDGLAPYEAAMFEDDARNLEVPHALGMKTVHIAPNPLDPPAPYVHFHAADLTGFLSKILA